MGKDIYCRYCKNIHNSFYIRDCEEKYEKKILKQNIELMDLIDKGDTQSDFRASFAVYRLYKFNGYSPNAIFRNFCEYWRKKNIGVFPKPKPPYSLEKIKKIISEVFIFLCEKDNQCIFKDYFQREKNKSPVKIQKT